MANNKLINLSLIDYSSDFEIYKDILYLKFNINIVNKNNLLQYIK